MAPQAESWRSRNEARWRKGHHLPKAQVSRWLSLSNRAPPPERLASLCPITIANLTSPFTLVGCSRQGLAQQLLQQLGEAQKPRSPERGPGRHRRRHREQFGAHWVEPACGHGPTWDYP